MDNNILKQSNKSDNDIFSNFLNDYYFVDYGFIDKISEDKKTIDVVHAKKVIDQSDNEVGIRKTIDIEVLFFGGSSFSLQWEIKKGDGVLLFGTKDYIESISNSKQPEKPTVFSHYHQENLKAIPFGFSDDPKTKISITEQKIKLESKIKNTSIELENSLKIQTDADLDMTCNGNTFKTTSASIKLNNNLEILK